MKPTRGAFLPILTAAMLSISAGFPARGDSPDSAVALPILPESVIRVSDVAALYDAVEHIQSGTTLVLEQGTYRLSKPVIFSGRSLGKIVLRGAADDWDAVVLQGAGMNDSSVWHGVMINRAADVLLANLTIRDVAYHCVTISPNAIRPRLYHCRLVDAGEQFVKVNSDGHGGGANGGIVEYCRIEYSKFGPADGYTNGIDIHGGRNWIIRHNHFHNIRTPRGAEYSAVPTVLAWNGAQGTICEGNTFVDCDRAIAFGLIRRENFADHTGGVIRNNFVTSRPSNVPAQDCGIHVHSPGTFVVHNTVLQNGGYRNAIEIHWPGQPATVRNNLVDSKINLRNGATANRAYNVRIGGMPFRDQPTGDLHLNHSIRSVPRHEHAAKDWDNEIRPRRTNPGADQP